MEYNRHNKHTYKSYNRAPRRGNHFPSSRHRHNHPYYNEQTTFDHRGQRGDSTSTNHQLPERVIMELPLNPLEAKAKHFLHTVLDQSGIRSKLVFVEHADSYQTLQTSAGFYQLEFAVRQEPSGEFVLTIDKEEVARGAFGSKQEAKRQLAERALEELRKDCFYIIRKKEFEQVSTKVVKDNKESTSQSGLGEGSKAHQMMLKMGWGGKGLGANEQGSETTVADVIEQNISREGLGTDDVFKKIYKLLEDYSKSDKMSLLKFDPDFTSDERAHIHKIALRLGLKSKSEGKGDNRRITITKKIHRTDLVYNLLTTSGLENSLYKLIVPDRFASLWNDEGKT